MNKLLYEYIFYIFIFIIIIFLQQSLYKKYKIKINSYIDYFKIPLFVITLLYLIDLYKNSNNSNLYEYDYLLQSL